MKLPEPLIKVVFKEMDGQHFYGVDGKDTYNPGVTTILSKTLGKPALVPWAAKLAAKAFRNLIEKDGFQHSSSVFTVTGGKLESIEKEAAKAPFAERDKAAERGTDVHSLIEQFFLGKIRATDLCRDKSGNGFWEWLDNSEFKFLAGDTPVVSQEMAYGGRLDALFIDKDQRLVLADVKTGKGVYGEAFIQMGGYAEALIETYGILPLRMIVLHVRPEKTTVYECKKPALARKAWRSVKTMYDDLQEINKLMEGIQCELKTRGMETSSSQSQGATRRSATSSLI